MIKYKTGKKVASGRIAALYQSVRWLHYKAPKKLQQAFQNSDFVVTAWDGNRLVGAARVISDGCFNAYIPDIAVDPAYSGRGIGREIVTRLLKRCRGLYNVTAVAEDKIAEAFYGKCGLGDERKALRKMSPITE